MQLVVDHANRRGAAAGETFDKLNAVISVGTDRNRRMHSILLGLACHTGAQLSRRLNSRSRAQIFHHLITSGHRTTQCSTNTNVRLAAARLLQHRIERNELVNVDRLQSELVRDPWHRVIANKPEMFLPKME